MSSRPTPPVGMSLRARAGGEDCADEFWAEGGGGKYFYGVSAEFGGVDDLAGGVGSGEGDEAFFEGGGDDLVFEVGGEDELRSAIVDLLDGLDGEDGACSDGEGVAELLGEELDDVECARGGEGDFEGLDAGCGEDGAYFSAVVEVVSPHDGDHAGLFDDV